MITVDSYRRYPIWRYLNARSAFAPRFSSDGQQVFFLSDITGVPQVWRVRCDSDGEPPWPDQLSFGADRVMGVWPSPAPGDGRLIYAQDVGGDENAQLFLLSAEGDRCACLTRGHEGAMHAFGTWSQDGLHILFAANRRDPGLFDLYLQPLEGEARLVWESDQPGYLANLIFSADGRQAIVTRMASSFQHDLIQVDLDSGAARVLALSEADTRYTAVCCAPDGRSLYLNTDLGLDFLHIARLDLKTNVVELVVAHDWDVQLMTLSPDGSLLAYDLNIEGASELRVVDMSTGDTLLAPMPDSAPGVAAGGDGHLTFSPDSRRLAFSYASAVRTQDVYLWDLASHRVRALTRSSHGGIPMNSFVTPELIHYPTFDSDQPDGVERVPAWFFKPAQERGEPYPAIVVVHGGPEGQFRPSFSFFIQYFVNHGYAVLAPNVRGSTGYGVDYGHRDDVHKRMDAVADLAHAALWLKNRPEIDGDRVAVYGDSYGGFMVLSALTTYPELWAAGVDLVGIGNFCTFLENTSAYRRAHREAEYGSLVHDRAFLESISPANHLDKIVAPLMVIHGANDPRVPVGETEQIVQVLTQRGVPVQFIVFDDEGHGITKLQNKLVAYPAMVDFLDKHIKG